MMIRPAWTAANRPAGAGGRQLDRFAKLEAGLLLNLKPTGGEARTWLVWVAAFG